MTREEFRYCIEHNIIVYHKKSLKTYYPFKKYGLFYIKSTTSNNVQWNVNPKNFEIKPSTKIKPIEWV